MLSEDVTPDFPLCILTDNSPFDIHDDKLGGFPSEKIVSKFGK